MADIKFNCPHCDQSLEAPSDLTGVTIDCPACEQQLIIPSAGGLVSPPPPRTVPQPTPETMQPNGLTVVMDTLQEIETPAPRQGTLRALKAIGMYAIGVIGAVGLLVVAVMLVRGGVWLSDKIYPWLILVSVLAMGVSVLALLPLAAFKETRGHSGVGFFIVSYVFGATLWVWSLLLTYVLWGIGAVVVGLFIMGVGVLPIALLATGFKGMWSMFGQLILMTIATFATRVFGVWLIHKAEQYEYDPSLPHKLIVTSWLLFAGSFMSYVAYVTIIPLIVCAIILCCSKARQARRHGKILLSAFVLIYAVCFLIGFFLIGSRFTE